MAPFCSSSCVGRHLRALPTIVALLIGGIVAVELGIDVFYRPRPDRGVTGASLT